MPASPPRPDRPLEPEDRRRRLAQIHDRDPAAEGVFWYSVVTTGVYCRPTCPSRRARPEHIRLHDTLGDARRTGFRPCARCRPEEPSAAVRRRAMVETACRRLAHGAASAADLAAEAGLSVSRFYRVFREVTGTTPVAWSASRRRVARASIGAPSGRRNEAGPTPTERP